MIKINKLSKVYSDTKVLDINNLSIQKGESFGLVGNNGAGKTTLFRLLLDLIKPYTGEVLSKDVKVNESDIWKQYTGSFLDEGFIIDFLTPEEYFHFIGDINKISKDQVNATIESFKDFFNDEVIGKKKYIRDLSKGNQKKVGIVASLIGDPEIIILDEPFTNLDPSSQIRLKKLLNEFSETKNLTMIISSHDLNHVTEVCKRIVVLEKGLIVKDLETNESTLKELEGFFSVE